VLLKRADAEQQTISTWLQGQNHVVAYEHHEGVDSHMWRVIFWEASF
jgi:hypothetical protein